jgi:hypothetical protein
VSRSGTSLALSLAVVTVIGAIAFLVSACAASAPSISPRESATPELATQRLPAATTRLPLATVSLKGTGSKTGPGILLSGDYTMRTAVQLKAGCSWRAYLDPLDSEPLDAVQSDSPGSHSVDEPVGGIDYGTYFIRVSASHCGSWSVVFSRT